MFNIWNLPFELQMKKKLFVKIGLIKFFFPVNYYSSFFQLLPPCCLFRKFYSTVSNCCLFIKTSNNDKKNHTTYFSYINIELCSFVGFYLPYFQMKYWIGDSLSRLKQRKYIYIFITFTKYGNFAWTEKQKNVHECEWFYDISFNIFGDFFFHLTAFVQRPI